MGNVCASSKSTYLDLQLKGIPTVLKWRDDRVRDVLKQVLSTVAFCIDEQTVFPITGKRNLEKIFAAEVLKVAKMRLKNEMLRKGYNIESEITTVENATVWSFEIKVDWQVGM